MADELREIASRASSLAERISRRTDVHPLAIDVIRDLVPAGARLNASQARALHPDKEGRWYAYLVMPPHWRPIDTRGWMSPEDSNYFWTNVSGTSKDEALRLGLKKLLDATGKIESPDVAARGYE